VKPEFRPLLLGAISAPSVTTRSDGSMLIDSCEPLGNYPERITDRLEYWATIDPERICAMVRC
jgi:feruloyl-CoA synthase